MHEQVIISGLARRTLSALVGRMIPASESMGLPGADDPAILEEIVRSLTRAGADEKAAVAALARLGDLGLADLPPAAADAALAEWRAAEPVAAEFFARHAVACYYRDDRVMASLGIEVRAPYPEGYDVDEGDWSLLDAVRARAPMYRSVKKLPDSVK